MLAGERHLARVTLHVPLEVGGLREALIADVAVKRLLSAVGEDVLRQGLQFGETLAALAAGVGPHRAVRLQVVVEECLRAEALVARRALKGLLSRVNALVVHQLGLVGEALIAHGAAEPINQVPQLLLPSDARPRVVVIVAQSARRKGRQRWERHGVCGDL